ncbi:ABC transporter permease [Nonomuraea sp. NPDC048826]|uniref:ABC transporter permease n=1 Tax=Nonomuraea sp. NPDC048826 TaxID=3364347 RepID=UPI0037127610
MSPLLRVKLRRDLRASWSRFALMVVAIAVSLTVFGGMLSAWAAIGRETGGAYLSTGPASATLVLDRGVTPERMASVLAAARTRPGVLEAAGRAQVEGAVEVGGNVLDIPLQVFVAAADDPMRMVRFDLGRQGHWPPPDGEIRLEADSLALLGVAVGDPITLHGPDGPVRLRVGGTVYDPSLAPSPQEQRGRGYAATTALPIPLDQVKLQIADPGGREPSRDRDRVVAVATEVGDWLRSEQGLTVAEIQAPEPYAHPHQWQADVLLLSLMAGGAAALLLSTILVATMLNTLFTRQIPQIGIMKAIGARSGAIGRYYLVMTLLVAAAATLVALGPAVWIGRTFLGTLLAALGVQPVSLAAPWWAYTVILAAGLGLPPLMALPPLVKAGRTTVRAAIDHHGAASGPGRLLVRFGRAPRLDRGLLMALRNTVRRPARFWLSTGLLAAAGAVFVAGMSLETGVDAITREQAAQRRWDVDVQLGAPAAREAAVEAARRVPGVTRAEGFGVTPVGVAGPRGFPVTWTYPDQGHGRITLTALPPGVTTLPGLLEGRGLRPGETGAVVLSQTVRKKTIPGLAPGDSVRLFLDGRVTSWRVAGIVEERGGDNVYATAEGLAAAQGRPQQVDRLRVHTAGHDERTRDAVAAAVRAELTDAGITVRSAASVSRVEAVGEGHMGPLLLVLLGIAVPLGVIGIIGLASTMSANVLDRTREFGIMHAIGARPRTVRRIVAAEGLLLALAGCLAAVVPAIALTWLLGAGLGNLFMNVPLPFRISALGAGIWVVLALLGAALATDAAATRASRVTVREALAYL